MEPNWNPLAIMEWEKPPRSVSVRLEPFVTTAYLEFDGEHSFTCTLVLSTGSLALTYVAEAGGIECTARLTRADGSTPEHKTSFRFDSQTESLSTAAGFRAGAGQPLSFAKYREVVYKDILRGLGIPVLGSRVIVAGPEHGERGHLLQRLLVVSLIHGHVADTHPLEVLPRITNRPPLVDDDASQDCVDLAAVKQGGKRIVGLGTRYLVLRRDGFRCVKCGRSVRDGARLAVNLSPAARGVVNTQTLTTYCEKCAPQKGNR